MYQRVFACGILFGCLSYLCTSIQGQTGRQPALPNPAGPYGIGRIGYDWTDTTRPDRYSSGPQAHRELMIYVWYPTAQKCSDITGEYLPGARQMDKVPEIRQQMRNEFGSNWPLIVSGAIFSHAAENAAIAKTPRQFPVIIFSHGAGSSGFEYTSLIEDLVSRGYVIASIEHTESAIAVFFPDGRIIPFHNDSPPPGASGEQRLKWMMELASAGINDGAADVRFVLNRIVELNESNVRQFPLAGRLDMDRVAAMGHSAGAEFAARACQLDARFKACVDLDGGMVPIAALPEFPDKETMKQPLLFLETYHPESQMGGTHAQHEEYFKKREEQLENCPAGTYAVVLRSPRIVHGSFSDYPLLVAGDHQDEKTIALHNLDLIEAFIRAFLDKTLSHQSGTLLDGNYKQLSAASVVPYGH